MAARNTERFILGEISAMVPRYFSVFVAGVVASVAGGMLCTASSLIVVAHEPAPHEPVPSPQVERERLARFQKFVGEWRGVGQPKRGSAKDAWSEECRWTWSFQDDRAALAFVSPNGKYLRKATLRCGAGGKYEFAAQLPAGGLLLFSGAPDEQGNLVFQAQPPLEDTPARITIRVVAGGDRLLMLYERRTEDDRYQRLAEVGFTRQGSDFGQGATYVECVVTGGVGTIPVTYEGQTYYVCCTGCRDYFRDNPAAVLADYRARKASQKNAKNAK